MSLRAAMSSGASEGTLVTTPVPEVEKSAQKCVFMQIRTDVLEVKNQITTQTLVRGEEMKNNMNGKLINDTS